MSDEATDMLRWLVSLDDADRRTVTLTKIIDRARAALAAHDAEVARAAHVLPSAEDISNELEYRVRTAAALAKGGHSVGEEVRAGKERILSLLADAPSRERVEREAAEKAWDEGAKWALEDQGHVVDSFLDGAIRRHNPHRADRLAEGSL